jgi:phytanoyl-CoA hydroxylase
MLGVRANAGSQGRNTVLQQPTPEQRQQYADQGFLVVEDFLTPAELDTWRDAVDHALMERGSQRFSFQTDDDAEIASASTSDADQAYYDLVFAQRLNLWQTDEKMRELLLDPKFAEFTGQLAGVNGLRIWHDQALVKPAFGNPTAFHLDVPYWSFRSPDAITIWLALDDASLTNGCLHYVPASHKAKKYDNVGIGPQIGALFDVYPEWAEVAAVPCPVPAGGALFHNGLTFHGAGANLTPKSRRAMTCAYMPDGCTFNGQKNVLPPGYLATLNIGDTLDFEEQNPLVYSRS